MVWIFPESALRESIQDSERYRLKAAAAAGSEHLNWIVQLKLFSTMHSSKILFLCLCLRWFISSDEVTLL